MGNCSAVCCNPWEKKIISQVFTYLNYYIAFCRTAPATTTCLLTRLDRVYPGPTRVSDGPVSVIYEDFVLIWELRLGFSALPQWRKRKVEASPFFILSALWHFPFLSGRHWIEALPNSRNQNKGFLNYVFCRKWAVRNPAGTRLDCV